MGDGIDSTVRRNAVGIGGNICPRVPKVAAARQPWAGGLNPDGILIDC